MRIIVDEPHQRDYVREYGTTLGKWYCLGCNKMDKTRRFANFVNGSLEVPVNHLCEPYTRTEVENRQRTYEGRRMSQKRGPKIVNYKIVSPKRMAPMQTTKVVSSR